MSSSPGSLNTSPCNPKQVISSSWAFGQCHQSLVCKPAVSALSKDFSKIQILGLYPQRFQFTTSEVSSEHLILFRPYDSHLYPGWETLGQMAAVVELSVVLTGDLQCGLNTRFRGFLGGNNSPHCLRIWKRCRHFCSAQVLALLAQPSVTCSIAVKPNPLAKGKQLCPIISKINASEASGVDGGRPDLQLSRPACTLMVLLRGRPQRAKPFLICCYSLKNAYATLRFVLSAGDFPPWQGGRNRGQGWGKR